jgi:glycosyltransferase involved in cell wall biosynthesis
MHVAINGWFWDQPFTGSGQYTRQLVTALRKLDPDLKMTVVMPPHTEASGLPAAVDVIRATVPMSGQIGKIWFEQRAFPVAASAAQADIAHVPYWAPPLSSPGARLVVTIHDVIPLAMPVYQSGLGARLYTSLVTAGARGAAHIITDSEFSKEEILARISGLKPDMVSAVPLATVPEMHPRIGSERDDAIRARYNLPQDYALYLGGFDVRKNLIALIAAWTYVKTAVGSDYALVLAGKPPARWGTPRFPDLPAEIRKLELEDVIQFAGPIDEDDKPGVYRMARLSIFPTIYEGFGLGPLESMACGTPVVSSDASSIPELVADAGYLVDPSDSRKMGGAIVGAMIKDELHDHLSNQGLARATNFSWLKTASATRAIYQKVAAL